MSYTPPSGDAVDFVFKGTAYTAPAGDAVPFVFGEGVTATVDTHVGVSAHVVAVATKPRVILSANVNNPWHVGALGMKTISASTAEVQTQDAAARVPWQLRTATQRALYSDWSRTAYRDDTAHAPWSKYEGYEAAETGTAPWVRSKPVDTEEWAPWTEFKRALGLEPDMSWLRSFPNDQQKLAPWLKAALLNAADTVARYPKSVKSDLEQWVPWVRFSRVLDHGVGVVVPPVPLPDEHGTYIVPIKGLYIMLNESFLIRVSDNKYLPALKASLSLDADSWCWSFSVSLPADQLQYVNDPEELLQISVNGEPFTFLPEKIARSRTFGNESITVRGRGRQALLDSPYTKTQTFSVGSAMTAQQLVASVLSENGIELPTTVTWNLTDWLIPQGAWTHQGSYMSALNNIAAAVGGYVQPHATDDALSFLHRYPTVPWEWATETPHYELPAAVTLQESIEWNDRPLYNRVFVSGTGVGVLGQVTRTGTAGDLVAPMVTDALLTAEEAARQRGRAELGATGRAAIVSLNVPVLEETGVIVPGKFVKYVDGTTVRLGLVRSVGVEVSSPDVFQTIGVEVYEPV